MAGAFFQGHSTVRKERGRYSTSNPQREIPSKNESLDMATFRLGNSFQGYLS